MLKIWLIAIFVFYSVADNPQYYGEWKITKVLQEFHLASISEKQAQDLIGTTIQYHSKSFKSGSKEFLSPMYKEKIFSSDEYMYGFRVIPFNLGLLGNKIREISVTDQKGNLFNVPGAVFLIKDKDTLIMDYTGRYFEMQRKQ